MGPAAEKSRRLIVARTIVVRGLSILAAFLLAALVSRLLGPEAAGAFFLIYAVVALAATLGRFGTDNLALRVLGGDSRSPLRDVMQMGGVALLWSAAGIVVCVVLLEILIGRDVTIGMAILVSTSVLPQAMSVLAGAVMRGLGYLSTGVWAELGSMPAVATLALGGMALADPSATGLDSSLIALAIGSWGTGIWSVPLAWLLARARLGAGSEQRGFVTFARTRFAQLLPMMGTSLLYYGLVWAPVLVLSVTSTLIEVSYYSVALRLANLVLLLPTIQVSYLAPQFASLYYSGNLEELNSLARRSVWHVVAITSVPLIVLCAAAPWIVSLIYGADFADAAPIVVVLSCGSFLGVLAGQVNQLMLLCGLERFAFGLTSSVVILWATAGLWIAGSFGAMGVAWMAALLSVAYGLLAAVRLKVSKGIRAYIRVRA